MAGGPGAGHRCSFRAPAANPGPTVPVESYFPFAEPMGIWRGHAEDRLQPSPASARGGCCAGVERPCSTQNGRSG